MRLVNKTVSAIGALMLLSPLSYANSAYCSDMHSRFRVPCASLTILYILPNQSAVTDLSGNGLDASTLVGSPTFDANGLNLTGGTMFAYTASNALIPINNSWSVYLSGKNTTTTNYPWGIAAPGSGTMYTAGRIGNAGLAIETASRNGGGEVLTSVTNTLTLNALVTVANKSDGTTMYAQNVSTNAVITTGTLQLAITSPGRFGIGVVPRNTLSPIVDKYISSGVAVYSRFLTRGEDVQIEHAMGTLLRSASNGSLIMP